MKGGEGCSQMGGEEVCNVGLHGGVEKTEK